MRTSNQEGRHVLINEDLLRQILEQVQSSGHLRPRQEISPRQEAVPNEYTVFDEDTIRDDELARHADDGLELDLNNRRNEIPEATFGSYVIL